VIQVRRNSGGGDRDATEQFTDPLTGLNINYLEITGLDLLTPDAGRHRSRADDGVVDRFSDFSFWTGRRAFSTSGPASVRAAARDRPGDKYFAKTRIATRSAIVAAP
jgi:hypothetical protein